MPGVWLGAELGNGHLGGSGSCRAQEGCDSRAADEAGVCARPLHVQPLAWLPERVSRVSSPQGLHVGLPLTSTAGLLTGPHVAPRPPLLNAVATDPAEIQGSHSSPLLRAPGSLPGPAPAPHLSPHISSISSLTLLGPDRDILTLLTAQPSPSPSRLCAVPPALSLLASSRLL